MLSFLLKTCHYSRINFLELENGNCHSCPLLQRLPVLWALRASYHTSRRKSIIPVVFFTPKALCECPLAPRKVVLFWSLVVRPRFEALALSLDSNVAIREVLSLSASLLGYKMKIKKSPYRVHKKVCDNIKCLAETGT